MIKFTYTYLLVFLLVFPTSAQFKKWSRYEKRWAIFHPFLALQLKGISKTCYHFYNAPSVRQQLDTFSNGGLLDAFRHTFFMAAFAQRFSIQKLRRLGEAHEKGNYQQFLKRQLEDGEMPDSIGSVMDLHNNELGFTIGKQHPKSTIEELVPICILALQNQQGLMVKRNANGVYVDETNQVLKPEMYLHQWKTAKCLVKTLKLFEVEINK